MALVTGSFLPPPRGTFFFWASNCSFFFFVGAPPPPPPPKIQWGGGADPLIFEGPRVFFPFFFFAGFFFFKKPPKKTTKVTQSHSKNGGIRRPFIPFNGVPLGSFFLPFFKGLGPFFCRLGKTQRLFVFFLAFSFKSVLHLFQFLANTTPTPRNPRVLGNIKPSSLNFVPSLHLSPWSPNHFFPDPMFGETQPTNKQPTHQKKNKKHTKKKPLFFMGWLEQIKHPKTNPPHLFLKFSPLLKIFWGKGAGGFLVPFPRLAGSLLVI